MAGKNENPLTSVRATPMSAGRLTPAKANKIARETGRPALATDGYIYLGASKEEAADADKRRSLVYGVRRAIEELATVKMSGAEFLEFALPHQLWKPEEEPQIDAALKWVESLRKALTERKPHRPLPARG